MGVRAHRERRRRVGRATWGPARQRALRREAKVLDRRMRFNFAEFAAAIAEQQHFWSDLTAAAAAASVAVEHMLATRVAAEWAADRPIRVAYDTTTILPADFEGTVLIVGFLGEPGPIPPVVQGDDGEWWPDAHEMRFTGPETARDRLDDWLQRSAGLIEEPPA